jgi:hypothetical protein
MNPGDLVAVNGRKGLFAVVGDEPTCIPVGTQIGVVRATGRSDAPAGQEAYTVAIGGCPFRSTARRLRPGHCSVATRPKAPSSFISPDWERHSCPSERHADG